MHLSHLHYCMLCIQSNHSWSLPRSAISSCSLWHSSSDGVECHQAGPGFSTNLSLGQWLPCPLHEFWRLSISSFTFLHQYNNPRWCPQITTYAWNLIIWCQFKAELPAWIWRISSFWFPCWIWSTKLQWRHRCSGHHSISQQQSQSATHSKRTGKCFHNT